MRNFFFILILAVTIISFYDCTGCSRSGRRKYTKKNVTSSARSQDRRSLPKETSVNNNQRKKAGNEKHIKPEKKTNTPVQARSIPEMFKTLEKGVFMVFAMDNNGTSGSQGSGFFINSSGIGVTNYHVLQGHSDYKIKTPDGDIYNITKILSSSPPEQLDYVIFKVNSRGKNFNALKIADHKPEIGEDVFAIGSPRGLENSLTKGMVSQYRENHRIQIDATIDHGSSGGPLFNLNGEVIGITTAGIEGANLNFAVDIQAIPYKKYIR